MITEKIEGPINAIQLSDALGLEETKDLLRNFPSGHLKPFAYPEESLVSGGATRFVLELSDKSTEGLEEPKREAWRAARRRLERLNEVILEKLGVDRERIPATAVIKTQLQWDLPGYQIKPHPDTENKIYTAQFFLAVKPHPELGTSFYRAGAEKYYQAPFDTGTGYAFERSETSFHGVEPWKTGIDRYSILMRLMTI